MSYFIHNLLKQQDTPKVENIMQTSDDLIGSLAHSRSVLACDEGPATGTRPVEEHFRSKGAWRGLYSPAQVTEPRDTQALPPPVLPGSVSLLVRRLSTTALGLGIVAVVGFAPLQGLLQTSSVEAVINARVITLRAPLDGEVWAGPNPLAFGTSVARG